MPKIARVAIVLGIIFAIIPDWAGADSGVIGTPTNLELEVDYQTRQVKLQWQAPQDSAPVERYGVFWFCKGCEGGGRAIASTETHINLSFDVVDDAGALDGRLFDFSIRSDNDSLQMYSGYISKSVKLGKPTIAIDPPPILVPIETSTTGAGVILDTRTATLETQTVVIPTPPPAVDMEAQRQAEATAQAAIASAVAAEQAAREAEASRIRAEIDARIAEAKRIESEIAARLAEAEAKAKAQADAILAALQEKDAADRVAAEIAKAKAEADRQVAEAARIAADIAAKAQIAINAKAIADAARAEADKQIAELARIKAEEVKAKAQEVKAKAEEAKAIAEIGVKPNSAEQLPIDKPKVPEGDLLTPRIQQDVQGVENGGIEFFGTQSQPQVVNEDGTLTAPAPLPGTGDPIPPDAITTAETFIGQPGGVTFNAPDVAVPVEPIEVNIEIPGVGQAAQAIADAYVAMANVGNDMSPITRKKAKKILVATIFAGAVLRRNP